MRRIRRVFWGLVLCSALTLTAGLAHTAGQDGNPPIESNLPAEVDEQLSDPKIEEKNDERAHKGAAALSSAEGGSRSAALSSESPPQGARHDDPPGLSSHGLRAPPA